MSHFTGRIALVTGAASGIGFELSKQLVQRGATVWLTDVDTERVKSQATTLGESARGEFLDVRDGDAFRQLALRIANEDGDVDLLFNNAGIGSGGEMHEIDASHFDRVTDINIRGVMNGIAAVYPRMVERRSGHVVNTASAAGLLPVPLLTPYAMTKHAVVGLTRSLRIEAARYGVRASALCPTAIDTPLLDAGPPPDLPELAWRPNIRDYLEKIGGPPMPVEDFANYALDRIAKNDGEIIAPRSARIVARLYRWFPGLVEWRIRAVYKAEVDART